MSDITQYGSPSPFDALRQVDASGGEHWSARDLGPALGYVQWRQFEDAVDRARAASQNSGRNPDSDLAGARKIVTNARGERRTVADYHLTRYGAYLVAMNGDPRKPEIAAAQTYFAVKTREAETRPAVPEMTKLEALRAAIESEEARIVAEARALTAERRARELQPKAEAWDIFAQVRGDSLVADAAKHLSLDPRITIGSGRLFAKLNALGWIFRAGDGRWRAKQSAVDLGRLNEHLTSYTDKATGEKKLGSPQVRVTIKGLYDLHRLLLAEADRRSYPALTLVELDAG